MKTKTIYSLALFSMLMLFGCEMEIADAPKFELSPQLSDSVTVVNDTLVTYVNHPVTFNMDGNPDNITFYSGETGFKYKNRSRNTVSVFGSKLSLDIYSNYGPYTPSQRGICAKLFTSKNFVGYTNDFQADSISIRNASWTELTDKDPLTGSFRSIDPVTRSATYYSRGPYTIDTLAGDFNIAISINYPALPDITNGTPIWNIRNFTIKATEEGTTNEVKISSVDLGFAPLNLSNFIYAPFYNSSVLFGAKPGIIDPYKTFNPYSSYVGALMPSSFQLWDLRSIGAVVPSFSFAGGDADPTRLKGFENWLISKPINFTKLKCLPDYGIAIKNMTKRLDSYDYNYINAGVYEVTFVANNTNLLGGNETIHHLVVKVIKK